LNCWTQPVSVQKHICFCYLNFMSGKKNHRFDNSKTNRPVKPILLTHISFRYILILSQLKQFSSHAVWKSFLPQITCSHFLDLPSTMCALPEQHNYLLKTYNVSSQSAFLSLNFFLSVLQFTFYSWQKKKYRYEVRKTADKFIDSHKSVLFRIASFQDPFLKHKLTTSEWHSDIMPHFVRRQAVACNL